MKKIISIILLVFSLQSAKAQFMDTLHTAFTGKKTVDFRFEGRWSFVNHDLTTVQSLKMGINFGKKISLGGGYSWLKTDVKDNFVLHDNELKKDTSIFKTLRLHYVCYYADYIFYKSKRWQYSAPMQFGMGSTRFDYTYNGEKVKEAKHFIALYEPGINVKYKIFRWMGLGANVGYRIVLKNNNFLSKKFNSPFYSAGVLIYWNELALAMFPKNRKVQDKLGPSDW
ncbi:MAG: hypothetical protein ACJ76F_08330 [Bacteroidia bacterium]